MASPITSILDTDLYKLTMQQAILHHFPSDEVEYLFYNRRPEQRLSRQGFEWFQARISDIASLSLHKAERIWLESRCPYFAPKYLDWLEALRLDPAKQVRARLTNLETVDGTEFGDVEIDVVGKWTETILYEVPLMALLSEAYFIYVDQDWSNGRTTDIAAGKSKRLLEGGCAFSEFGTRRRRSYEVHDLVLKGILRARNEWQAGGNGKGKVMGTSNVHFAMKYDLMPIGTIAHEWTMGIAARSNDGYETANERALDLWEAVYPPAPNSPLHIALTDTLTTADFFRAAFTPSRARAWRGLRQDSGDPITYAKEAKRVYGELGVSMEAKVIVFSDALDVERCLDIQKFCDGEAIGCSFGVGTFLTNDFQHVKAEGQSKPLNIVIKLSKINGQDCVKISDEITKNTGRADTVAAVKRQLNLSGPPSPQPRS